VTNKLKYSKKVKQCYGTYVHVPALNMTGKGGNTTELYTHMQPVRVRNEWN